MKKSIILLIVLWLFSPIFVFAATNPYPKTQTFNGEESVPCTRVVWQEVYERLGIALPGGWGNAVNWLKNAKNAGYEVGEEPRDNSIAVYSGFYGYGHVAYVLEVFDDYMQIIEGGVVGAEKQERTTSFEIGSGSGIYLTGFIYLDKVPSSSTSSTSSNKTTTTKKDSNSFLKTLEILNISLNFQKDVFTYTLTVPYETEKIKLNVEPEKKTSKVEWKEEYALDIGENTIRIKVTAEDKSSSTYILYITREDEKIAEEIKEEDRFVEESKKDNRWLLWIPIPLLLLTILGLILKKIIKRK